MERTKQLELDTRDEEGRNFGSWKQSCFQGDVLYPADDTHVGLRHQEDNGSHGRLNTFRFGD